MSKTYIHYGAKEFIPFDKEKVTSRYTKPDGNILWACPLDAAFSWHDWCEENDYCEYESENCFEFKLSESAKILTITSIAQACKCPQREPICGNTVFLDFAKLSEEYDGVEVSGITTDLYLTFYGWDCDSIAIWNSDVIVPKGDN